MFNKFLKLLVLLLATGYWLLATDYSFAEIVNPNAVINQRAKLEEELKGLEGQIEAYRATIQDKQRESTTLERDIAIFDAKIGKAKLEIKARNISISELTGDINKKSETIDSLIEKTRKEKASLTAMIRKANELDSTSLVELILEYKKLSDFFVDMDSFESIYKSINDSFYTIKKTKETTEKEKNDLEDRKAEEVQLKSIQEMEKERLEEAEAEKKKILKLTKGEEKKYQEILSARQKDAAKIRSALFMLQGSTAIPFEKAIEYANVAWKATGVRPAFLLGVIAEESNLGENVGKGNWITDLAHYKCAKQRTAFIQITGELGLDPNQMPVSKKVWYGYCGGAMGPAQFMPTTWLLYKNKISNITGSNPPNPWNPKDAFVASALLLKDNGASAGGYSAERKAALKYLAGSNWSKSAYAFYGDDVMELATKYQSQMDILLANSQ
jgi:membrane-bound lytic murein transglycosylase B